MCKAKNCPPKMRAASTKATRLNTGRFGPGSIQIDPPAQKKPHEKVGLTATPFLAKGASNHGLGGCPDLRRFADHSGGTVADSHGLPRFPILQIVDWQSKSSDRKCQHCVSRRADTFPAKINSPAASTSRQGRFTSREPGASRLRLSGGFRARPQRGRLVGISARRVRPREGRHIPFP